MNKAADTLGLDTPGYLHAKGHIAYRNTGEKVYIKSC